MSSEGLSRLPMPPAVHSIHDKQDFVQSTETLHSPSGSFNDSHSETEPSSSFRASQYRQSAVLELGSAIPMEIGHTGGPKEIQIRMSRASVSGMDDVLSGMNAQRDILRRLSQDSAAPVPDFRDSPNLKKAGPKPAWSASPPKSMHYRQSSTDQTSPQAPSQKGGIPVSPLNYPPSTTSSRKRGSRQTLSSQQRDSEEWVTAMESSGDDESDDDRSLSVNATALESFEAYPDQNRSFIPENIFDPRNLSNTSWQTADLPKGKQQPHGTSPSKDQRRQQNLYKLHQIISEENNMEEPEESPQQHSRSFSEPTHILHPLPSPPAESKLDSSMVREYPESPVKAAAASPAKSSLPSELIRQLSEKNHSNEHPMRSSSRRRGYDTVAPHVALRGEAAIVDSDPSIKSRNQTSATNSETRRLQPSQLSPHHRKSHSDNTEELRPRRQRRNFTKKSIEDMTKRQHQLDIEDIGLPGPERRLLERFIDSLSKLSIEVQMDERKREEGLRRLNNALRALEGWI